jgi:hypothetical protein
MGVFCRVWRKQELGAVPAIPLLQKLLRQSDHLVHNPQGQQQWANTPRNAIEDDAVSHQDRV